MKKLLALCAFALAALASEAVINVTTNVYNDAGTTNVVTNIVQEVRVRYTNIPITNGWTETYSGTLITNTVVDNIYNEWTTNGLVEVTNSHDVIVGGSVTNTKYDITYLLKPNRYYVPITNVNVIVR